MLNPFAEYKTLITNIYIHLGLNERKVLSASLFVSVHFFHVNINQNIRKIVSTCFLKRFSLPSIT